MKSTKTAQAITILTIYRFKEVSRICFEIESTDGSQKYNVCFDGDTAHGSCNCIGHDQFHKVCRHITGLTAKAQEYFDSRQPESDETPGIDAAESYLASLREQVAAKQAEEQAWNEAKKLATAWQNEPDPTLEPETYLQSLHRMEREQRQRIQDAKGDAWKERAQFGGQAHKMELVPGTTRLVPMR